MTRGIGRALATVGVTASVFAVFAAPSLAHFVYASASTSTFGSEGSGAGQFKRPQGVAIDEATEDVYVVDEGDNRVERFEADGKYLSEIDGSETPTKAFASPRFIAVDNSGGVAKGHVYVADPSQNVVDAFDSSGKYLFQIEVSELRGITTDTQGHLWACTSQPAFEEYSETGALTQRQPVGWACRGMVVDSNDNVYITTDSGNVIRYSPPNYLEIENNETNLIAGAQRLAINTVTNNIFQDSGSDGIVEWPPFGQAAGTELWSSIEEEFSVGLNGVGGLAVKAKDGLLYASDELSGDVKVFTPIVVPDATTGGANKITTDSGTIEGSVNPDKTKAEYFFEWGETTSYGNSTALEEGEGEVEVPIDVTLGDLEADTTYHYRVVASNDKGVSRGVDRTFTTSPVPPEIEGAPTATGVAHTSAILHAIIDARHSTTTFHFAYVEEAMYDPAADDPYAAGGSTTPSDMGAQAGGQVISQLLEGLRPDTTYHFKVVAFNQSGRVIGTDGTFTTGAATPPTVVTGGASNVAENTATISGVVDTNGLPTAYGFEIGTSTDYGPPTGLGAIGAGASKAPASLALTGLLPGTTYHYRLTATNVDGMSYGADQTFTTSVFVSTFAVPPAPLPFVEAPAIAFPSEPKPSVVKKKVKAKGKKVKAKGKKVKKRGKARSKKKPKIKKK
jgi:hypothetical protein